MTTEIRNRLDELLAKVEAATAEDPKLDREIFVGIGFEFAEHDCNWHKGDIIVSAYSRDDRVTASLDAAVALVEKMLPGCWLDLAGPRKYLHIPTPSPNYWRGMVNAWDAHGDVVGWGATPALALIAALLKALVATKSARIFIARSEE